MYQPSLPPGFNCKLLSLVFIPLPDFILTMKRLIAIFSLLLTVTAFAQPGYEIKVTFKPFKNQYVYLGHYFGKTYPVIDSILLNEKSEGVFKGTKKLQGGVYLIGYPNRSGFFEMLIDKQQRFSVIADTATIKKGVQFINSPDNDLFYKYQLEMIARGKEVSALQQQLKVAANKTDSAKITDELVKLDKSVLEYRQDIIKKNPDNILTALLNTMKEPVLTGRLKDPKNEIFPIIKWVGERNQIFNVHLRNIKGSFNNFQEVYPDNGEMNFLHVVRALRDVGFSGMVMPDHVPHHHDPNSSLQAFSFCYGYIKGLIQAVSDET